MVEISKCKWCRPAPCFMRVEKRVLKVTSLNLEIVFRLALGLATHDDLKLLEYDMIETRERLEWSKKRHG